MSRIQILPDHLISQIAAGEVVERPASVVKELVENALDAGAREVAVDLEVGGKRRIVVTDDGQGMDKNDALLAFDRHATSKIATFEDLERVGTLGFRGEALASVAAVARVELLTAEAPGDGHRVRIEGGQVRVAEPAARAQGTTVEVASLFFNVPARRKFLKSPQTELRRAVEVVQGYALARPDVRFDLRHEGRILLEAVAVPEAEGDAAEALAAGARERIAQIFGRDLARQLAEIPGGGGAAGERLWGFVGGPETARRRRTFVFVNRRLLRDRAVLAAFYRSVREEWRGEDFPALFLFVDLPGSEVDVNVHPQKAEVRFRDPRLVDRVEEALRRALQLALGESPAPLRQPAAPPAVPFAWQGLGERKRPLPPAGDEAWRGMPNGGTVGEVREGAGAWGGVPGEGVPAAGRLAGPSYAPPEGGRVPGTGRLSGRSIEARPFRLLGQYKGTLILLEGPDGLYLVDQHVAHERVLYERLRRALLASEPASQRLLTPLLLELSSAEEMRLSEMSEALESFGFEVASLSGGSVAVAAVPALLSAEEAEKVLTRLAMEEGESEVSAEGLRRSLLEAYAASLACRSAVKMHEPLAVAEMQYLVADLFEAENPFACPHGRPIVLKMTDSDLERRFGRR